MNNADKTKRIIAMMTGEKPVKFFTKPGCLDCERAVCSECDGRVETDIEYDRHYIPLPGGWEIQTKGKGSTFRVLNRKTGERLAIPDSPYLHETLEQMAREINAACTRRPAMTDRYENIRKAPAMVPTPGPWPVNQEDEE